MCDPFDARADSDCQAPGTHDRSRRGHRGVDRGRGRRQGLPAGCVLATTDDGHWRASGLGRLWEGEYLDSPTPLYADGLQTGVAEWVTAFSFDRDEPFWSANAARPPDADGVGELPGGQDAIVSNFVLRWNTRNPWGATRIDKTPTKALVSDLVFFGSPETLRNQDEGEYNVLFADGLCVRTARVPASVMDALRARAAQDDIERIVDKELFERYFDPAYQQD